MQLQPVSNIAGNRFVGLYEQTIAKMFVNQNTVGLLTEAVEREVLEFLAVRPVQTVVITGFIQDNGLESAANRGKFYGYRNAEGKNRTFVGFENEKLVFKADIIAETADVI